MLIYICCSGGATSSMLCQRIATASNKNAKIGYILEVLPDIEQHLKDYDMVLAYGPVDFVKEMNIKGSGLMDKISCIYIAPQVRFMTPSVKKFYEPLNVPVGQIDMHTFGVMDGEKAWEEIQNLLKSRR